MKHKTTKIISAISLSFPTLAFSAVPPDTPLTRAIEASPYSDYWHTSVGHDAGAIADEHTSPILKKHITPEEHVPVRRAGASTSTDILARKGKPRESHRDSNVQFFSPQPLTYMPYLDSVYTFSNSCIEPGAWFQDDLLTEANQYIKTKLSKVGFTFANQFVLSYVGVTGSLANNSRRSFASDNGSICSNLTLFRQKESGNGLFFATEFNYGHGYGYDMDHETPSKNIGAAQNVTGYYQGQNGVLGNAALGYSCFSGKLMTMVGQLDAANYLDHNAYAGSHSNQLMNKAYVNTTALPLPFAAWGYHVAFQPTKSFYMMLMSLSNNTPVNHNPFNYISSNNWENILELGFIREDVLGLGVGTYRFQPFYTTTNGENGFGMGVNFQQQLGRHSPLGWFFRGAWADPDASTITGVKCSAATGIVMHAPFRNGKTGRFTAANRDYLGLGFVWLEGSKYTGPHTNSNEYGIELTYVMQVTPTMTLQPDVQVIRDPINGKKTDSTNVVLQLQCIWQL